MNLEWFWNMVGISKRESVPLSEINPEIARRLGLIEGGCGDGVQVSEDSILALGTLWRAARVISEGVGNLPLKMYRRTGEARQEARDHVLWPLIHRKPHPRFTAQKFWTQLVWWAVLHGTGVAKIERTGATATGLTPILPWRVTHKGIATHNLTIDQWYIDGLPVMYEDLIIINGPSLDGSMGYRLCQVARDALSYFISTEKYGSVYFKNHCDLGGFLVCPPGMTDDARDNVFKSFIGKARGVDRSQAIAMLEDGVTWQGVERDNESAQFHETRERNALEICKHTGCDPVLCFEYGRATWANSTEGRKNFLTFTLQTYLQNIENELSEKVILPSEQDVIDVEFERSALIEMDALEQMQVWTAGISAGIYDANEIRHKLGLPPLAPKPEPTPVTPGGDNVVVSNK